MTDDRLALERFFGTVNGFVVGSLVTALLAVGAHTFVRDDVDRNRHQPKACAREDGAAAA